MSLDVDVLNGKANLKLSSISLADNKEFECHVQIPDDEDGTQAASARLVVLGNISHVVGFLLLFRDVTVKLTGKSICYMSALRRV